MLPQPFKYFTYKEALRTCTEKEIVQCVNRGYISNLFYMLYHLDRIRHDFGSPIIINSSYRNEEHNNAVHGVSGSQHLTASALDIRPRSRFDMARLYNLIIDYNHTNSYVGQLILHKNYLHIGALDLDIPSCSKFKVIDYR